MCIEVYVFPEDGSCRFLRNVDVPPEYTELCSMTQVCVCVCSKKIFKVHLVGLLSTEAEG